MIKQQRARHLRVSGFPTEDHIEVVGHTSAMETSGTRPWLLVPLESALAMVPTRFGEYQGGSWPVTGLDSKNLGIGLLGLVFCYWPNSFNIHLRVWIPKMTNNRMLNGSYGTSMIGEWI